MFTFMHAAWAGHLLVLLTYPTAQQHFGTTYAEKLSLQNGIKSQFKLIPDI